MLLTTKCKSCSSPIEQSFSVSDRIGLAQKHGDEIKQTCASCGAEHTYTPDDFKAISNSKVRLTVFLVAVGISVIGGILGMLFFRFYTLADYFLLSIVFAAPIALFFFYVKNDIQAIRLFNRLKLKGHNVDSKISSTGSKVQIAAVDKQTSIQGKIKKMNKEALPSNKRKNKQ